MATVDIVLPVYNEERVLRGSVESVLRHVEALPLHEWRVVIADNASSDGTLALARELEQERPGRVVALHVPVKGRGIALRTAWLTSPADVLAYMDVDLATDLAQLAELIDPVAAGEADLSFGTRLAPGSATQRSLRRTLISRGYLALLRWGLGLRVSDAQCGFKAISSAAARELVPLVHDTRWFFDSELLTVAQRNGYRLHEVPVRWVEGEGSKVAILRTALEDMRGVWRLRSGGVPRARGRGDETTNAHEPPGASEIP